MDFSEALLHVKDKKKIFRDGWNGKNLMVKICYEDILSEFTMEPYFCIFNLHKKTCNTWVPSISDLLADDWESIGDEEIKKLLERS